MASFRQPWEPGPLLSSAWKCRVNKELSAQLPALGRPPCPGLSATSAVPHRPSASVWPALWSSLGPHAAAGLRPEAPSQGSWCLAASSPRLVLTHSPVQGLRATPTPALPQSIVQSREGWTSNVVYWASSGSFLTLFPRLSSLSKDMTFPSHFWMPPADTFLSQLDGCVIFTPSALFWIKCLRLRRSLPVDEGASESTCSSASQERVVLPLGLGEGQLCRHPVGRSGFAS